MDFFPRNREVGVQQVIASGFYKPAVYLGINEDHLEKLKRPGVSKIAAMITNAVQHLLR